MRRFAAVESIVIDILLPPPLWAPASMPEDLNAFVSLLKALSVSGLRADLIPCADMRLLTSPGARSVAGPLRGPSPAAARPVAIFSVQFNPLHLSLVVEFKSYRPTFR
jgi:hypothetical protein